MHTKVRLQPLVLFQIISAYEHRPKLAEVAVGTLLGLRDRSNDTIEITNSYMVIHKTQQIGEMEQVKLDKQYASEMYELNQINNPQEKIVGWYNTAKSLSRSSAALHAYYARECADAQPLHLLVDLKLRGGRLNTRLYCGVPIGVPGGTKGLMFTLLPLLKMGTEIDDSVALRVMQNYALNPAKQPGRILPELMSVLEITLALEEKLDLLLRYIKDVLARKRLPDKRVGRALYEALTSVPMMDAESFRLMFNTNVRDILLSITLSTMIKTQLELSEKLSHLPNH
ncbi:GH21473 [Drosophila grimshawi]|nr:GH21473 [Drosophila grimshawi]